MINGGIGNRIIREWGMGSGEWGLFMKFLVELVKWL